MEFARNTLLPDGPHKGERWNPETEPVQDCWIRQLSEPRWKVRVAVAPSQRGKSLMAILVPCLRTLCEERDACAYVMPSLDKLAQNWEGKIKPSIEGCGFGAWLPEKGPGARGGKAPAITFRDPSTGARAGTLYFMAAGGGGKETALSSVTVKRPLVDEADDFESEGHVLLALKRNESFGDDGEAIIASTVNDRGEREGHPILDLYQRGTKSRLWYQCPQCAGQGPTAGFQPLDWLRVDFDRTSSDTARDSARYSCRHCPAKWDDSQRHQALRNWRMVHDGQTVDSSGVVTGPDQRTTWFTLLANGLEFHMGSMPKMAADYHAAQVAIQQRNDHSAMRLFHYKVLCLDYDGDKGGEENAQKISVEYLQIRAAHSEWGPVVATTDREADGDRRTYSRHIAPIPRRASLATVAVDVQGDRCYWTLIAGDHERRTWDAAWGYEYATPDRQPMNRTQLHAVLDRIDGLTRAITPLIVKRGVDTNFKTDDILAWLRMHHDWSPVYGASAEKAQRIRSGGRAIRNLPGILSLNRDDSWHLPQHRHHIDTNPMRMLAQNSFLLPQGDPGAAHLPHGLKQNASDRAYLQHLCGEEWDAAKSKWVKAKGGSRHDWLDTRVYAYALMLYHLDQINYGVPQQPTQATERPERSDWIDTGPNWDISSGNLN